VCACEDLEESRRTEVQQAVGEAEERWRKVLEEAGESLRRAETQAVVEEKLNHFKTQKESVLSWVRQHNHNLTSLGGHMTFEESLQIPQVSCDHQDCQRNEVVYTIEYISYKALYFKMLDG